MKSRTCDEHRQKKKPTQSVLLHPEAEQINRNQLMRPLHPNREVRKSEEMCHMKLFPDSLKVEAEEEVFKRPQGGDHTNSLN